jgi:hypothetical protein
MHDYAPRDSASSAPREHRRDSERRSNRRKPVWYHHIRLAEYSHRPKSSKVLVRHEVTCLSETRGSTLSFISPRTSMGCVEQCSIGWGDFEVESMKENIHCADTLNIDGPASE